MDSKKFLKYGLTGAEVSYKRPSGRNPAYSQCIFGSAKLALGNSPVSPLSSQFEGNTFSVLSNNSEQQSFTKAYSGVSPSHYSQLEENSLFSRQVYSPESIQVQQSILNGEGSCPSMRYALEEIETVLMAPDTDQPSTSTNPEFDESRQIHVTRQLSRTLSHGPRIESLSRVQPINIGTRIPNPNADFRPEKRLRDTAETNDNDVKQLLFRCAEALFQNNEEKFKRLVEETRSFVSISGEPIQRLGAYMLESLVARHESSGTNIYRALRCRQPESNELFSYMRILYDVCPYLKFGYMAANGAIAEALKNEDRIHIIDFQIVQGTQWVTLIQALAARPGGPPHVRITGIDDPVSEYARGDGLHLVGEMLLALSKKFNIPLEFHGLPADVPQVTREMLGIRSGEALAVNFTLQLHHIPDESVDVNNPRDELLRMVKGLSPKVTTLVEQESNTNTTPFLMRFLETLDYYSAMFESIDVTMPRDSKDRISVEQHCLAKDIVNIIACEGKERVERHELLGKWQSRLTMAGFKPFPLSSYVNSVIKTLLGYYSDKYTLVEKDGAMLLGWKNRYLVSASAWH